MKKLILILILAISATSYTQWTQIHNTGGNGQYIRTWCVDGYPDTLNMYYGTGDGKIMKSSDNGNTWITSYQHWNSNALFGISCIYNLRIYMAGGSTSSGGNVIRMSLNHGTTWSPIGGFPDTSFTYSIVGMNNVIYLSNRNTIEKSYNYGLSWQTILSVNDNNDPSELYAKDSVLYYSSRNSTYKVYKTTNQGATWTEIPGLTHADKFTAIGSTIYVNAFYNSVQGIWKSTNKGDNWSLTGTQLIAMNSPIIMGNNIIASSGSNVWVSTNECTTWSSIFNQGYMILRRKNYVFVSDGQYIFRNTLSNVIAVEQLSTTVPKDYQLSQNYPNPFNPSTRIEFKIQLAADVKLTVYDILGKVLTVLVNKQLNPGTYQSDWDASQLATGVYLYKLTAEDYTETKKMILIK